MISFLRAERICLQSSNEGGLVQEWRACTPSTSKPLSVCRVHVQKTQMLCEIPIWMSCGPLLFAVRSSSRMKVQWKLMERAWTVKISKVCAKIRHISKSFEAGL